MSHNLPHTILRKGHSSSIEEYHAPYKLTLKLLLSGSISDAVKTQAYICVRLSRRSSPPSAIMPLFEKAKLQGLLGYDLLEVTNLLPQIFNPAR